MICTYRPGEIAVHGHPLRAVIQELAGHGLCRNVPLTFLTERAVEQYLRSRLPEEQSENSAIQALSQRIYQRTEGNPLFIVNLVDYVFGRETQAQAGLLSQLPAITAQAETGMPTTIRALIDKQLDRLNTEAQRVLEVASIAGGEFATVAIAAGINSVAVEVETCCQELARSEQFIQEHGISEWPDGTIAIRYGFSHALYQEVLSERVSAGQQVLLHRLIGERKEAGYGQRANEIAAELAVHFERGRLYPRAIHYRQQAAENALRRYAPQEASQHLSTALELLRASPPTPEHLGQELALLTALGPVLISTKGWGALEVEQVYTRAQQLCQQLGETPQLFSVLWGLWAFHISKGDTRIARAYAEQLFRLAQEQKDERNKEGESDSGELLIAHQAVGATAHFAGEFISAKHYLEQGLALYRPQEHASFPVRYGFDIRVSYLGYQSFTLWSLGYPDQAVQKIEQTLSAADESAHPHSLALSSSFAVATYLRCGQVDTARKHVERLLALAQTHGFPYYVGMGVMLHGQVLIALGQTEQGIQKIHQGIAIYQTEGAQSGLAAGLTGLAWAYGQQGRIETAMKFVAEAFTAVQNTGELCYLSALHRIKGSLLLRKGNGPLSQAKSCQKEAEDCFHKALELARSQEAKSLELEAALSLSWLWHRQGKNKQARQFLEGTYGWFTEGFETQGLRNAKALLDELAVDRM